MKVLIMNRRDIRNPLGGGAEIYTHEVAKGLIEAGRDVTVFSSRFKGSEESETIDGVRYVRGGNEFATHFKGFLYAFRHRRDFDLIIDEYNGLGFFGFLLPRSMILIHQLYREFWFRGLGPAGIIPYVIEPLLLRFYRKMPAVTVSESTRQDLRGLGFKNVRIVMNALSNDVLDEVPEKEEAPTLMFLGRLAPTKNPVGALEIYKRVRSELPEARLWIAGSGPQEEKLRDMAAGDEGITFFGWVDEERKFDLLGRAHIMVVPGVREGFGINVIEAASQGTPAVGYDVHGLRDSIRDGNTGLLADSPGDAALKALRLLKDRDLYERMAGRCLEYARGFNWKNRAAEFRQALAEAGFLER
jgi:glycosyltransferase involved in cell wall biosynthesis